MPLRLGALVLVLVFLSAGAGADASTRPSSSPLALAVGIASRDDPRVGRPFVGYVLVLPTAARRRLVSVYARCPGTVLGRTVPGRATSVPAGDAVPSALICTWSIPRDRLGWTFRARMELDVQRRLRDGGIELVTEEGRTTGWIIQP